MARARVSWVPGWAVWAVWSIAACGRVGYDAPPASGDAGLVFGAPEAAADADESDAEPAAGDAAGIPLGVNLARNPGCENGLDNWTAWQGSLFLSSDPRTGATACGVCTGREHTTSSVDDYPRDAVARPEKGQVYAGRAWVRGQPGASRSHRALMIIREWVKLYDQAGYSAGVTVALSTTEWRELAVEHTVTRDGLFALDAFVLQQGEANDCFVVDDISLVRVR